MLCFISYDIEHNKVRTAIAKYLIRQGCQRVQKSVYFARLSPAAYRDIATNLREIQALYDNQDSIFILPVGEDNLNRMELIGQNFQYELEVNPPNTLYF